MYTYTNVRFDQYERGILRQLANNLPVHFPQMHDATENPDWRARVVMGFVKNQDGGHAQLTTALWAANLLRDTLARQSDLVWWLELHGQQHGVPVEPSDEPTSGYQQYVTLAGIRGLQLRETDQAIELLEEALAKATPNLNPKYEGV